MNDMPVSDAPTTTILVLFSIFVEFKCFLLIIDKENGAYYSSQGFLLRSIPPLLVSCL